MLEPVEHMSETRNHMSGNFTPIVLMVESPKLSFLTPTILCISSILSSERVLIIINDKG